MSFCTVEFGTDSARTISIYLWPLRVSEPVRCARLNDDLGRVHGTNTHRPRYQTHPAHDVANFTVYTLLIVTIDVPLLLWPASLKFVAYLRSCACVCDPCHAAKSPTVTDSSITFEEEWVSSALSVLSKSSLGLYCRNLKQTSLMSVSQDCSD